MRVTLDGYGDIPVARTFRERWRGLRGSPPDAALLLRARSVHGFGMERPLLVVGLDDTMTVIGAKELAPRRVVTFLRGRWVLELPKGSRPPERGTRLSLHG